MERGHRIDVCCAAQSKDEDENYCEGKIPLEFFTFTLPPSSFLNWSPIW